MSEAHRELEDRLRALTEPPESCGETMLWQAALGRNTASKAFAFRARPTLGVAASLLLVGVVVWTMSGTLGRARSGPPVSSFPAVPTMKSADAGPSASVLSQTSADQVSVAQPRAIQRSATMELTASDTRALADRITGMVQPGLGEFVGDASVGAGSARMTLRVASDRLEAVMRSIRGLQGVVEVSREELSAVDATDRRTDLTARLTNERRIEIELLELVEQRPDAPLADILRVREALGEVRLSIERLGAQRAALQERIDLATLHVLVVLEEHEGQHEPAASGFVHDLGQSLKRGGRDLARSITTVVEFLIGGLIVWAPLLIVGVWTYRTLRWRATWD